MPFQKGNKLGKKFQKGQISAFKGRKHIPETIAKMKKAKKGFHPITEFISEQVSGQKNPNWRGGIKKDTHGYVWIWKPNHPSSVKRGYIRRSHLIMEKKIGRYLRPEEVIHHINGNPSDDRPANLMLFPSNAKHRKFHKK